MKNNYNIDYDNNIVYIKINCKGESLETMIDLEDFNKVNSYSGTYYAHYDPSINNYYVRIKIPANQNGKRKELHLHRIIMNVTDPKLQVDHIYHNTLDNRKSELKVGNQNENQWNQKEPKGYHWHEYNKKWCARITINGKGKYLGSFNTEEEAKEAYLNAKEIYHTIEDNDNKICEFEKSIKKEIKGYYWDKIKNKWKSKIIINKKEIYVGHFDNEEDAHKAYIITKENFIRGGK